MRQPETRIPQPRWRSLGSMALAIAAVTVIGFTTVTPAKADDDDWRYRRGWHEREWRGDWRERREESREQHPRAGFYFNYGPTYTVEPYGYYEHHYYR